MLSRAWGRSLALLARRGQPLLMANLEASLGAGLLVAAWVLAVGARLGSAALMGLKAASALAAWALFSWLAFCARRTFEDAHFRPGLAEIRRWARLRGAERALSFLAALLAAFWIGLAFSFYRSLSGGLWIGTAAFALCLLLGLAAASALALNFGLSSRLKVEPWAEWKAALLMAFAFAPQCLGALLSLLLASGAAAFISGAEHWWGRLLWAPSLTLPLFGAALLAAFLVALADEFLAASHGEAPPAYERITMMELIKPWR